MSKPLVTIAIPTYNRPIELQKALKSVIGQTYKDLEIIISDNCSMNPEVEEICCEYAKYDNRIKYFRQKENLGIGANMQFLINNASGRFYFILNDDDWISENFIEEALNIFLENPNCSIVYGETRLYDLSYGLIDKTCFKTIDDEDYAQRLSVYAKNATSFLLATGLMKTDQVKSIKEYGKNRFCEDQIYMSKMLYFGELVILPQICYHKLKNGNTKDLETLKLSFNMPDLTYENFYETIFRTILSAVLYDEFYDDKFAQKERIDLAFEAYSNLIKQADEEKQLSFSSGGSLK